MQCSKEGEAEHGWQQSGALPTVRVPVARPAGSFQILEGDGQIVGRYGFQRHLVPLLAKEKGWLNSRGLNCGQGPEEGCSMDGGGGAAGAGEPAPVASFP